MRISLAIMFVALFALAFSFRTHTRLRTAIKTKDAGYGPRYAATQTNGVWSSTECPAGETSPDAPYPCACECYWETGPQAYFHNCYDVTESPPGQQQMICGIPYECYANCFETGW